MGLFSKKSTKVEKVNEKTTQSKIVKLSYLQSIAVSLGVTTAADLTETEGSTKNITNAAQLGSNAVSKIEKNLRDAKLFNSKLLGNVLLGPAKILSSIGGALFGKKKSQSINLDVTDSGWSVVKIWNEPQFDIIRYAIGIRELVVTQFEYQETSEFVSTPWLSPKAISKVSLTVDQFVPTQFPPGQSYIDYYVKPNTEDATWIRINPLGLPTVYEESGKIVPRIITFNSEKPANSSIEESYVLLSSPVKSVRFRAVFKRPTTIDNASAYTPVLRSYRLLFTISGGL